MPDRSSRLALTALALAAGATLARGQDAPAQRAEELVARLHLADPAGREEATRDLLELAEAEDSRTEGPRPVHEVLKRALVDPDSEVRFRARRVLSDPEVRVERLLLTLLEPAQTEVVRATKRTLLEQKDRPVARAGLLRIARKAARAGFDRATSTANETWTPFGLQGGAQLVERRRFHMALDLLGETATDDEAAVLTELLHEDLGDSLPDVIDALGTRPDAARPRLRRLLADPRAGTRENAAWALGELGTAEDAPALDLLLSDPDPRVRRAAVSAFEVLPVDAAACVQAAGRANDADPSVAAAALHVGAVHGHRFVGDAAKKILAGGDAVALDVRLEAIRALGRIGDQSGILREIVAKSEDATRTASWATGAAGDLEGLGELEKLMVREDFGSEPSIYYGIARAGALGWLERLVRSPRDDTRRLSIQALGAAKGDADKAATLLRDAGTRALDREGGAADWVDFLTSCRALRDRADDPARKAIVKLLDQAVAASSRGNGIDETTLARIVELVHQARATGAAHSIEQLCGRNRSPLVRAAAMDALATLDPARARKILGAMLETEHRGDTIQVIVRSLARAGDPSHVQAAVDVARTSVAAEARPGRDRAAFSNALNGEGIEHAYAAEVDEAVLCFRRMRWLTPDDKVASYNISCCLALGGRTEAALRWLRRSVREGFRDWRHIRGDADLTILYEDPRFLRIIDELREEQEVDPAIER